MGFISWIKNLFSSKPKNTVTIVQIPHHTHYPSYTKRVSYPSSSYRPSASQCVHSGVETINSLHIANRTSVSPHKVQNFLQMCQLNEYPIPETVFRIENDETVPQDLLSLE